MRIDRVYEVRIVGLDRVEYNRDVWDLDSVVRHTVSER